MTDPRLDQIAKLRESAALLEEQQRALGVDLSATIQSLRDLLAQLEQAAPQGGSAQSRGIDVTAGRVDIGGDAVGRDKKNPIETWFTTFANALLAWQLETCEQMLSSFMGEQQSSVTAGLMALNTANYTDALPMLALVLNLAQLDAEQQARLQIFVGRIHLFHRKSPVDAKIAFDQAQALSPDLSLVYVAQGDYARSQGNTETATEFYERSLDMSRSSADAAAGAVGLGLVDEELKRWSDANRNYDYAIEKLRSEPDLIAALSKLAAPVSGNLYLQAARALRVSGQSEAALAALERAMYLGIQDDSDYPERIGYRLKGDLLSTLAHNDEASDAYESAGVRFVWVGQYNIAFELFELALKMNPKNALVYWDQADAYWRQSTTPQPPFVSRELLEKSEQAWKAGISISTPNADNAWVYALWAYLRELRSQLDLTQREDLLWEGVVFGERAVAASPVNAYNLGALSNCYQGLDCELNALHLSRRTAELYPDDQSYWLEDLIVILSNYGYSTEALEKLRQLEQLGSPDSMQKESGQVWSKAMRAFNLLQTSQADIALGLINESLASSDYNGRWIWFEYVRINCHRALGQYAQAQQYYQQLFDNRGDPNDESNKYRDSSALIAWAAYYTDHLPEAFDYAKRAIQQHADNIYTIQLQLAQFHLAPGETYDIDESQALFTEAVENLGNLRQLRDTLDLNLNDTLRFAHEKSWPDQDQVVAIIEDMQMRIKNRLAALESEPEDAGTELQRASTMRGSAMQALGIALGTARLLMDQDHWREAVTTYDALGLTLETYPEIVAQRNMCLDKLHEQVDTLLGTGDYGVAADVLEFLLMHRLDDAEWQAGLHIRLEVVRLVQGGDYEAALSKILASATEQRHVAGQQLGESLVALKPKMSVFWPLRNAATNLIMSDPLHLQEWTNIRQALDRYLDRFCQLDRAFEVQIDEFLPIAVELGEGLIPERTGVDEWVLFTDYVPTLREQHIFKETGVKVTGISFRRSGRDTRDGYTILLDEMPVERGRVELDKRFCPASADTLKDYHLDISSWITAPNPLTGEIGYWAPPISWESIVSHGSELWAEPLVYAINHLEAVLRRNLARFIGLHEFEYDILPMWRAKLPDPTLIDRLLPDRTTKIRFIWLLRELAAERVPLVAGSDILQGVSQTGLTDLEGALRVARLRLSASLPGNRPGVTRRELPTDWEQKLFTRDENNQATVTGKLVDVHAFLQELRTWIDRGESKLVLVTSQAAYRRPLRRLISGQFPDVMVMSQEECQRPSP